MDVSFDFWLGDSLQDIIPVLAEFRSQMGLYGNPKHNLLSDEIVFLRHYLDSEACVIVANDCGALVGYIGLVTLSEHHPGLGVYDYYGDELRVTEGPLVHPSYRSMGIAKSLIQQSLDVCQQQMASQFIIDPSHIINSETQPIIHHIATHFLFEKSNSNAIYSKSLIS